VGELILLLHSVCLQVDKIDRWQWHLETSHVFSVHSAYNMLTSQPTTASTVAVSALWSKDVPLKVVLLVWRLFRDRLPTKDNLLRRGVISYDSRLCVAGCDSKETSSHLFLHCNSFGSVWHLISRWLGISAANPFGVSDHFNQFTFDGGTTRAHRAILQVIWFATK